MNCPAKRTRGDTFIELYNKRELSILSFCFCSHKSTIILKKNAKVSSNMKKRSTSMKKSGIKKKKIIDRTIFIAGRRPRRSLLLNIISSSSADGLLKEPSFLSSLVKILVPHSYNFHKKKINPYFLVFPFFFKSKII